MEDKLHSQHDRVRGLGTNLSPVLLGTNNLLGLSPSQILAKKQKLNCSAGTKPVKRKLSRAQAKGNASHLGTQGQVSRLKTRR